jgi:hypothetical protein
MGILCSSDFRLHSVPLKLALVFCVLSTCICAQDSDPLGSRQYFYLSDKRIITVELINDSKTILNYINLSDRVELVRAIDLLIVDQEGETYRGHLFPNEEEDRKPEERFKVDYLVMPGEFRGLDVLSNFDFKWPPEKVYFRVGARVIELEPVTESQFNRIADNVGQLDLGQADRKGALLDAGFWQGFGQLHRAGSEKGKEISALLPDDQPLPPRVIKNPPPRLAGSHKDLVDPVIVRLKVLVVESGGMLNAEVSEGVNEELDELALEVVRNSWVLLPAVAGGKPVAVELTLRVVFQR